jgi:penicillin-binding protein 2
VKKKTKFLLLRVSIIAAFAILSGRLWYVQVVMSSYYKAQGDTSKIRTIPVEALRGIIYDRNGTQLVFNAPAWKIEIVPHGIPAARARQIYAILSHLLHNQPGPKKIASIVAQNEFRPYTGAVIKDNVVSSTAMLIKQLHAELPGVRAVLSSKRSYRQDPGGALSQILGYTTGITSAGYARDRRLYSREKTDPTDQAGATGIEEALDPYLHGINGRDQVEVDAGERPVRTLHHGSGLAGDSVYLTINWKLQQKISADLSAGLAHLGLSRGIAILENVRNGQILAMSSLPSFNNNQFSGGISQKAYDALLNAPGQPLIDHATQGLYPPGSTYKIVTAAAALQTGVAGAYGKIDDTGQIQPCSTCQIFHGWKPGGLGSVDVVGALAQSSDIYFYTVTGGNPAVYPAGMPKIGGTRLAYWAHQFGLGEPSGIELPEDSAGFIPTPAWFNNHKADRIIKNPGDRWTIGYDYNSAIGQGFDLTTPLQMVNVAATIANGGTLYQPRIVRRITGRVLPRRGELDHPTVIQPFVPAPIRRNVVDSANIVLIQQGMHESVDLPGYEGTSYAVRDPRIDAAGKTGTAEDGNRPPHAWWVGYAPFYHPQVAIVVMVPNAGGEGAYVAAPIAHKLLEDYFNLPAARGSWLDNPLFCTCLVAGGGTTQ